MSSSAAPLSVPESRVPVTEPLLRQLEAELEAVRAERARLAGDGKSGTSEAQIAITAQLNELELTREHAEVVVPGPNGYGTAAVGTSVTVQEGDRERTYRIVLERGAAPTVGTVSATSPVGVALLGRALGETVTVQIPGGRTRRLVLHAVVADPSVAA